MLVGQPANKLIGFWFVAVVCLCVDSHFVLVCCFLSHSCLFVVALVCLLVSHLVSQQSVRESVSQSVCQSVS